jgi:gentisate 1,2-dioxygenase
MATPGPARDWSAAARFYEYTQAADPPLPAVPVAFFAPEQHASGATRVMPWDLSAAMGCPGPATAPGLLASFVRITAGASLRTAPQASSQLFYVIAGGGLSHIGGESLAWGAGDVFTLPAPGQAEHAAGQDSVLYWIHDGPLLAYLGAAPAQPRFGATLYTRARIAQEVARVRAEPGAQRRNRLGVIFGNSASEQTMTVTHGLWSLFNVLPAGVVQKPHRHNSVALDLCIAAGPGVYSLMSRAISPDGSLIDPIRADWRPGGAFVTPPGWWHSHHNESQADAEVLPVQDAGLHTYLRTLDIQFSR